MPVYNGRKFLGQAVESVLAQTYQPIELIAVDDGSTDGSTDILAAYYPQVRVVRQANAGVSAARNAGVKQGAGEFIAFLDQDDWWLPKKISRQLDLFQSDDRIGLVHTAVAYYDETNKRAAPPQDPTARPEEITGACYESLLLGNPLVNSSAMVRRSALDGVGGLDVEIRGNTVQDYDLWLRIAKTWRLAYVRDRMTVFRLHDNQGHRDRRAMLTAEIGVLLRHRPLREWLGTTLRRRRLADLHDSLATAHFEAGDVREARRHFAKALRIEPCRRRWGRFGASCLPYSMVSRIRRAWHRRKLGEPTDYSPKVTEPVTAEDSDYPSSLVSDSSSSW
jgi:glycosyltransferase involved in cell wall biosynthesis